MFTPQSTEMDADAQERLSKVIEVMNDKPRITMLICAQATRLDLEQQVTNESAVAKPLTEQQRELIISLATQRQQQVIQSIVEKGNIERSRLIGCNVKIAAQSDAQPIVELSL